MENEYVLTAWDGQVEIDGVIYDKFIDRISCCKNNYKYHLSEFKEKYLGKNRVTIKRKNSGKPGYRKIGEF